MNTLEDYTPRLPSEEWAEIRDFALDVVGEVVGQISYAPKRVLNAAAHHVHWCVNVQGLPATREVVFRKDVIAVSIGRLHEVTAHSRGTFRSILLRVAETLGVVPVEAYLPGLGSSNAPRPYSPAEVGLLRFWARFQPTPERTASARALVTLGIGAGLATRELVSVRACDVTPNGQFVQTFGPDTRFVTVAENFRAELSELVSDSLSQDYLFRPGVRWTRNIVTNFVTSRRPLPPVRPEPQRMRSTWIVSRMSEGLPVPELLRQVGVKHLGALERFQDFLPSAASQPAGIEALARPAPPRPGGSPQSFGRPC